MRQTNHPTVQNSQKNKILIETVLSVRFAAPFNSATRHSQPVQIPRLALDSDPTAQPYPMKRFLAGTILSVRFCGPICVPGSRGNERRVQTIHLRQLSSPEKSKGCSGPTDPTCQIYQSKKVLTGTILAVRLCGPKRCPGSLNLESDCFPPLLYSPLEARKPVSRQIFQTRKRCQPQQQLCLARSLLRRSPPVNFPVTLVFRSSICFFTFPL